MMPFSGAPSKTGHQRLPLSYYEEMESFLAAFKKETMVAEKDGRLHEQEADLVTWTLFREILQWDLDRKSIYLGVFSILQWNCMTRSITIGVLALYCFHVVKITLLCAMIKPRHTRQEKRLVTITYTMTTHLIHWFRFFLRWGVGFL